MRSYSPLHHTILRPGARVAGPTPVARVTLDDPALSVMTDLHDRPAVATTPAETIDRAHLLMVQGGVRLLFVVGPDGVLAGVITATDILGEKPMRLVQDRRVRHEEILVSDVMTAAAHLQALSIEEVAQMRVGHIVETFKQVGRQHLIVAEEGGRRVRGLFSASQVARQLGFEVRTTEVARTFADIEAALVR